MTRKYILSTLLLSVLFFQRVVASSEKGDSLKHHVVVIYGKVGATFGMLIGKSEKYISTPCYLSQKPSIDPMFGLQVVYNDRFIFEAISLPSKFYVIHKDITIPEQSGLNYTIKTHMKYINIAFSLGYKKTFQRKKYQWSVGLLGGYTIDYNREFSADFTSSSSFNLKDTITVKDGFEYPSAGPHIMTSVCITPFQFSKFRILNRLSFEFFGSYLFRKTPQYSYSYTLDDFKKTYKYTYSISGNFLNLSLCLKYPLFGSLRFTKAKQNN